MRSLLTWLALVTATSIACDESEADEASSSDGHDECEDPPSFSELEIFAKCTTCHASTLEGDARGGALASVDFDTAEAAMMSAARGLERVEAGAMPPPSSGLTVTPAEVDELERWVLCGTP